MRLRRFPVLPLKNTVLFPYLLLPLAVDKPFSVAAVEAALAREDKELVVVAQRNTLTEVSVQSDLYAIGTKAVVKRKVNQEHGGLEVILLGTERSVIIKLEQAETHLQGRVKPLPLPEQKFAEVEALHREVLEMAGRALDDGAQGIQRYQPPVGRKQRSVSAGLRPCVHVQHGIGEGAIAPRG